MYSPTRVYFYYLFGLFFFFFFFDLRSVSEFKYHYTWTSHLNFSGNLISSINRQNIKHNKTCILIYLCFIIFGMYSPARVYFYSFFSLFFSLRFVSESKNKYIKQKNIFLRNHGEIMLKPTQKETFQSYIIHVIIYFSHFSFSAISQTCIHPWNYNTNKYNYIHDSCKTKTCIITT